MRKTTKRAPMDEALFPGLGKRSLATIETIEVAALREILKRGYEETTADHIAAASDVSVRTFFRYFQRGKDDVMLLQFRRWIQRLVRAMASRPPQESAWTSLREAAREAPSMSGDDAPSIEAVHLHYEVSRQHPEVHARTTGYQYELAEPLVAMAALRMSTDPKCDVRPRLMVHAMITAATVAWLAWLDEPAVSSVVVFDQSLDLLEIGMKAAMAQVRAPAA